MTGALSHKLACTPATVMAVPAGSNRLGSELLVEVSETAISTPCGQASMVRNGVRLRSDR
ncbi:hypothetical protein GCM10022248_89890 [Nonomuraea soli]